jgi:hypothetical protein
MHVVRLLAFVAILGAISLAGSLAAPSAAGAADAKQLIQSSSLGAVKSLSTQQAGLLRKARITSAAKLGATDAVTVAKLLKVDPKIAAAIVRDAQTVDTRLSRVYIAARSKFKVSRIVLQTAEQRAYADLVAPTNECTILARKVCGEQFQCASSPGCPVAMELVNRYNAESDPSAIAGSCLIALEDPVIFNQCVP